MRPHHPFRVLAVLALTSLPLACKSSSTSAAADGGAPEAKDAKPAVGPAAAAEKTLRSYLVADCVGRLKYILSPEKNRATLEAHYSKKNAGCTANVDRIVDTDVAPCARVAVGSTCLMNAWLDGNVKQYTFEMQRLSTSEFKIDWRSSMPYNPMTFAAYRAKSPKQPVVFRVSARLSDYFNYNWSNAKPTHYSIELEAPFNEGTLHGYIPKVPDGERLFSELEDGKPHGIMVMVKTRDGAPSDMVDIVKFVRPDWREAPEEF